MLKPSHIESLTRRSSNGARSRRQSSGACKPTNQVRFPETLLAQRSQQLTFVPRHQACIVHTAQPTVGVLPTLGGWVAHPQAGLLNRLLTLLATEPEPDKLPAHLMLELATQLGADGACLFLTDAASQTLALAPWAIVDGTIRHSDSLPALEPLMCLSAFEPLAAPQVKRYMLRDHQHPDRSGQHRRLSLFAERNTLRHDQHPYLGPTTIAQFRQQGYRVGLTLPLLAGGQTLGFLECLARDEMAFLPSRIELARALAEQLSLALQFARLTEHAAHAAALEERQRLAREIHDTLGQAFTAILLQLRSAEETLIDAPDLARTTIGQVRALAHDGLSDTRRAVDALRPQALERFDLATALRRAVVQATLGTPLEVHCTVHGDVYALPIDTALQLLRIAQEALCNTLKYADAQRLTIELVFEAEQLELRVQDDGRGFDPTEAAAAGGFGLLSMRARAAAIGAELTICSAPGQGTSLLVALPHNTGASNEY
jgi:signal transduction histidine kinase